MVSGAPLSISRALSASLFGLAGGSEEARHVDPAAALREATERNAREEREAAARAEADAQAAASVQTEAQAAAAAQAKAATKAQAEADAKATVNPAGSGIPEAANLELPEPPVVEDRAPTGAAGADQTALEREVTDPVVPEAEVAQRAPGAGERGGDHPEGPEVPPANTGLVTSQAMTRARPCARARRERPQRLVETGPASLQGAGIEATSSAPPGWASGASIAVLNLAVQDVLDKFATHSATLLKARSEMVAMQTSVRDYHNLRASAFNSQN